MIMIDGNMRVVPRSGPRVRHKRPVIGEKDVWSSTLVASSSVGVAFLRHLPGISDRPLFHRELSSRGVRRPAGWFVLFPHPSAFTPALVCGPDRSPDPGALPTDDEDTQPFAKSWSAGGISTPDRPVGLDPTSVLRSSPRKDFLLTKNRNTLLPKVQS